MSNTEQNWDNNISTVYFDYRQMDYTVDQLISLCDNKEVIILDNADLYLTQNLLDYSPVRVYNIDLSENKGIEYLDEQIKYFIEIYLINEEILLNERSSKTRGIVEK